MLCVLKLSLYVPIVLIIMPYIISQIASVSATPLNNDSAIKGEMDEAHTFSLQYNSSVIQTEPNPRWNMTVWIDASPLVLKQIDRVVYHPYPGWNNSAYPGIPEEKFALFLPSIYAGPIINSTVYFKDNRSITYDKFRTSVPIPFDIMKLNITYQGLTVTLDERIDTDFGNITNINISWGDGKSASGNFPINHTYLEKSLYTIIVTASTTRNILLSESINTIGFSPDKDERANAKLTLYTNYDSQIKSQALLENRPFTLSVYGNLTEYAGNKGIPNQRLELSFLNPQNILIDEKTLEPTKPDSGHYSYDFSVKPLPTGLYRLIVQGKDNYSSISQAQDILIPVHQITISDLFATSGLIIGVASGVSGLVSALAVYVVSRIRIKNLGNFMTRIINEYKKYKKTTDQVERHKYISRFENMREEILEMLQKGKIDENKYQMLDQKISSYIEGIRSDLGRTGNDNHSGTD
jgi:hypothetical protein